MNKMAQSKFITYNEIFIVSTAAITPTELLLYLTPKFCKDKPVFPKGTIFYFIDGVHGKEQGELGPTDSKLTSSFYHGIFEKLMRVCGLSNCENCMKGHVDHEKPTFWKEMEYGRRHLQIFNIPRKRDHSGAIIQELSDLSVDDLNDLSKELCESKKPSALIFASCFSAESKITDLLRSNGILASMNISKDRMEITDGRAIFLDPQQQEAINRFREVCLNL